ncbi:MAG TPA: putative baseplate assembly protein [Acidimicrobiales bacterium]
MPLPVPNLDDRRFQQLVDDAKRLVQQRCPEWTDHNVSDPGVTLIETFAYMVDQLIYRLNRVPDRNYLKFLELIGVRLFPPVPARVPVTFWLSAPQADAVHVSPGTLVATVRTETEEAVTFTVLGDLDIVACTASALLTEAAGPVPGEARYEDRSSTLQGSAGFYCFNTVPVSGNALMIGLSDPVPSCVVALRIDCRIEGVGVDPRNPPLAWQAWTGEEWAECELERDETGGLNRAGDIVLHVPPTHRAAVFEERRAGWLRALVVTAEEGQPAYSNSPRVNGMQAFTIGGTIEAVNARPVTDEIVGSSAFVPAQRFDLRESPVVPGRDATVVEVAETDGWMTWSEVPTFADSTVEDRHFQFDRHAGQIVFGPAVRQPDGTVTQYGAIPPKSAMIRIRSYLVGGGRQGNVVKGALSVLKTPIPFVATVQNRRSAAGGVDGETVEEAKVRGPILLRTRNRAVTKDDYEELAREAAPEVARVHCVAAGELFEDEEEIADAEGGIRVLVVPMVEGDDQGRLRFEQLIPSDATLSAITAYLDDRRVVGSRIVVEPPTYQAITVVARLRSRAGVRPHEVADRGAAALYRYFHPITGGPQGTGWPFGRPLHVGEVYALLQRVDGVELVEDARLFPADPITGQRSEAVQRVDMDAHSLVFSYEHLLRVEE